VWSDSNLSGELPVALGGVPVAESEAGSHDSRRSGRLKLPRQLLRSKIANSRQIAKKVLNVYKKRVHRNRQRLTVLAENSRWSLLCGRVLVSDAVRLR
jgi:hypothetical protein